MNPQSMTPERIRELADAAADRLQHLVETHGEGWGNQLEIAAESPEASGITDAELLWMKEHLRWAIIDESTGLNLLEEKAEPRVPELARTRVLTAFTAYSHWDRSIARETAKQHAAASGLQNPEDILARKDFIAAMAEQRAQSLTALVEAVATYFGLQQRSKCADR